MLTLFGNVAHELEMVDRLLRNPRPASASASAPGPAGASTSSSAASAANKMNVLEKLTNVGTSALVDVRRLTRAGR